MGMYLSTFGTVCLEGPKWRDSLAAREALGSPLFLGLYVVYRVRCLSAAARRIRPSCQRAPAVSGFPMTCCNSSLLQYC